MSEALDNLMSAQEVAMKIRPAVGGFPHLAEVLRSAGVVKNSWTLPSCQAVYYTTKGTVVTQMPSLIQEKADVPSFDEELLIKALRLNQAGKSTFPEFLQSSWEAGVIRYDVDFNQRTVSYYGCNEEVYVEEYPAVELSK